MSAGTVGELVGGYLAEQCDVLASNDIGLRVGDNLIHKTRVAARRLRSTLRVFAPLFAEAAAQQLNLELSWYADLLGEVRDRDVRARRFVDRVAALPTDQHRGSASEQITRTLREQRRVANQQLLNALHGDRYPHLVKLLRSWRTAPPFTDSARAEVEEITTYVDRAQRKADRRLRKAGDDVERLHRARKAIKRARYAAELATPANPAYKPPQRRPSTCRPSSVITKTPSWPQPSSPRTSLPAPPASVSILSQPYV